MGRLFLSKVDLYSTRWSEDNNDEHHGASKDMNESKQARGSESTVILEADKPTGEQPIALTITDEHSEDYLTLQDAGEQDRGHLAGFLGWLAIAMICFELLLRLYGISESVLIELGVTTLLFLMAFLRESRCALPLPIIFNRRTQEVYVDHDGVLFHAPWEGMCGQVDEFKLVGTHLSGMSNASLEIRVRKFEQPDAELVISLGAPFGKSLKLQQGGWEYLRAYMSHGPWFDEQGRHNESYAFLKDQLSMQSKVSNQFMPAPMPVKRLENEVGSENYISGSEAIKIMLKPVFYPMCRIQKLVNSLAKHRSHSLWPSVVIERLKADGPTTRLVDLEQAKGRGI